ncbi:MAG: hypothetical protein ACKVS7_15745 [Gemmatimonadaceae bacterium]
MRSFFRTVPALLLLAASVAAQETTPAVDTTGPTIRRWHFGVSADIGRPVGAFKKQVDNAAGLQAHLRLRLDDQGLVSLRLHGGWLNYGHESLRTCLAATPGCRVNVSLSTANGILMLGIGPEVSVPMGKLRAYGHGLVGMSRFATLSGLGGGILPDFVAADENFGDGGFVWSAGGGVELPIGRRTALDLGVSYQGHGRREYLTAGGITDNADGSVSFDVRRSSASLFAIRLGITRSLSWGSHKSAR